MGAPRLGSRSRLTIENKYCIYYFMFIHGTTVFVLFSSYSFWTSSSLDVPAGVTRKEGHTGFLIHLLSAGVP